MAVVNLPFPFITCFLRKEAVSSRLFYFLDVEGLRQMFAVDRHLAKGAMSSLLLQSADVIAKVVTSRHVGDSSEVDELSDNDSSKGDESDLSWHSSQSLGHSEHGLDDGFGTSDFCSTGPWCQAVRSALHGLCVLLSREDRIRSVVLRSALRLLQHRVGHMEEDFEGGHTWKGSKDNMEAWNDLFDRFGDPCAGRCVEEVPFAEAALRFLAQFGVRDDKLDMVPLLDLMTRQPDLQRTILAVLSQVCQDGDEEVATHVFDLVREGEIWDSSAASAALRMVAVICPRGNQRIVSGVLAMWGQRELPLVEALALLAQTCCRCRMDENIVDVVIELLQHVCFEDHVLAKIRHHIVEHFIVDLLGFLRDHFDTVLRKPVSADQNVVIVGLNVLVQMCQCGGESIVDTLLEFLRIHVAEIMFGGERLYYEVMASRSLHDTDAWKDGAEAQQRFIEAQLEPIAAQLLQVLCNSAAGFGSGRSEVNAKITSDQEIKLAVLCLSCRYHLGRKTQFVHDCSAVARWVECMSQAKLNVPFKIAFCRLGVTVPLYPRCPSCSAIVAEALARFSQ